MRRATIAFGIWLALSGPVFTQVNVDGSDGGPPILDIERPVETPAIEPIATSGPDAAEQRDRVAGFLARRAREIIPPQLPADGVDDTILAAYNESTAAFYRQLAAGYAHRRAVFDWQLLSSKMIFAVAVLLVAAGVYFSWLQFKVDRRLSERARPEGDDDTPELSSTLKFGTEGVEVSSPVLGVIILVISLAFFYLYLVYVYPISEVP